VKCPEKLILGKNTDIGAFTYIGAHEGVEIGDNCEIGGGVKIYSLSTIDNKRGKVIIKGGARIGANSVIMPNVIMGQRSTIGALSFVKYGTRILPDEVWGGIPAKKIGDVANVSTVL